MTDKPEAPDSAAIVPWDRGARQKMFTTLDPADTIRAINDTKALDTLGDKVLHVQDVVMHSATVTDEAGDPKPTLRTILVGTDPETGERTFYASVSDGVVDSIALLSDLYGNPPWKPALDLKLVIAKTRRGFRTFKLIPA